MEQEDHSANIAAGSVEESGSSKVQFGEGTKQQDGRGTGVSKMRRSFKDIVLKDVIGAEQLQEGQGAGAGGAPKSILKVRSEPALADGAPEKTMSFINKAYEGDDDGATTARAASAFKKSGLALLAGGGGGGGGHGFADVVDLLIQRTSLDTGGRDVHPFGRDCSIEGIMAASRPKSHSKNSAFGKLVIWMTLLSFLLGAAFGIIFLSETYNAKQRDDRLLRASHNTSYT